MEIQMEIPPIADANDEIKESKFEEPNDIENTNLHLQTSEEIVNTENAESNTEMEVEVNTTMTIDGLHEEKIDEKPDKDLPVVDHTYIADEEGNFKESSFIVAKDVEADGQELLLPESISIEEEKGWEESELTVMTLAETPAFSPLSPTELEPDAEGVDTTFEGGGHERDKDETSKPVENCETDVNIKAEKITDDDETKTPKKSPPRKIILKRFRSIRRKSKRIRRSTFGKDRDSHVTSKDSHDDEDDNPFLPVNHKPELLAVSKAMHNGVLYRIGDIINMTGEDGGIYYAQLKYFLSNQYCEHFVTIRWLLPNSSLRSAGSEEFEKEFSADLFCQGPDQIEPVNMDHINFVMHLPYSYSFDKVNHYHQEEHGLIRLSLPETTIDSQSQFSSKTATSV